GWLANGLLLSALRARLSNTHILLRSIRFPMSVEPMKPAPPVRNIFLSVSILFPGLDVPNHSRKKTSRGSEQREPPNSPALVPDQGRRGMTPPCIDGRQIANSESQRSTIRDSIRQAAGWDCGPSSRHNRGLECGRSSHPPRYSR